MSFNGFGKSSGPKAPPTSPPPFGAPVSVSPPANNPLAQKSPATAAIQQPLRPRPPPMQPSPQPKSLGTQADMLFENGTIAYSERSRSPPLASESNQFLQNFSSSNMEAQRPDMLPLRSVTQRSSLANVDNSPPHRMFHSVDYSDIYDTRTALPSKPAYFNAPQRVRSPPLPSANVSFSTSSVHLDPERPDVSPHRFSGQKKSPVNNATLPPQQRFYPVDYSDIYDASTLSPPKTTYFNASKRSRSPPITPASISLGTSSVQNDPEREMNAKAKRLARFNVELSQPMGSLHDITRHKSSGAKYNQVQSEKKPADVAAEEPRNLVTGGILLDYEGLESSEVVVGICPDMCPESERDERERKGDLDKYERLDGERNQTNKFLAVKKYTRTAEREADLIRPMPVLQNTVDYLLQLLDQPYNDDFLGIYNFLWDRMRAIRMDLRMQHIFDREAIIMLEQMIRLHIIVMHELCEYKKGEGFSEGFDAHLNIEQMNKTSVELFQMYDDHRKKGNGVQTEKEFRGYYALLKLDKHPGYKVEPAELSHDLAKMTPEIRCTPELLFARDVARACRIGNYIAFFRLARKATYLQACLMHAHFAKVRRQALASLHCGLQNNQGIPISHVAKWLGMEEENIESLLEYHGFAVKKFEELYMVKENPFLNMDSDFPTMSSQLVHHKKSRKIIDDVYSGQTLSEVAVEKEILYDMDGQRIHKSKMEPWDNTVDEAMLDHKVDSVEDVTAIQQLVERPSPHITNRENDDAITEGSFFVPHYVSVDESIYAQHVDDGQVSESDADDFIDGRTLPKLEASIIQAAVPGSNFSCMTENFEPEAVFGRNLDDEELVVEPDEDEALIEKLKMILRKWKQRSSMLRETREQKKFLANAALNSLSLGPPIQQNKAHPRHASEELNIDCVARERDEKREKMWSGLNVSELVAPVLSARNSDARCICWKLVIFVQVNGTETNQLSSRWLLSKLKGKGGDDGLIVSLPHLSVWKKWISFHINDPQICCLSVIREAMFNNNDPVLEDDIIAGTSCIMFVVSETIPWETQKVRLHNLLMAVPCGSRLPLLVVSTDTCKEEIIDPSVTIISRLGLHNVDRTRINKFSVVFLADDSSVGQLCGFFNDIHLRNGLQWMANHAPLQPAVHVVKTRDLVLNYLRYCTEVLDNLNISEVSPDHCISAFNVALDRSADEILTAASVNQNYWPCPEITLLEDSSNERKLANLSLPSIGWSSDARIEPLIRAIKACKLPSFPTKMLWPSGGFSVSSQIQSQKLAMEDCLASYLLQSCQLLNVDLAAREASVMLQKVAVLELHGSCFRIVPMWLPIFWRIYNWQLTKLNSEELSEAYVLNQLDGSVGMELTSRNGAVMPVKMDTGTKDLKSSFGLERHRSLHSFQTVLSLDEMVEVSCSFPFASQQPPSVLSPVHKALKIVHDDGHVSDIDDGLKGTGEDHRCRSNSGGDVSPLVERNKEIWVAPPEKDDRLAVLLEQCNRLQDKIDEKLSVYF